MTDEREVGSVDVLTGLEKTRKRRRSISPLNYLTDKRTKAQLLDEFPTEILKEFSTLWPSIKTESRGGRSQE